MTQPYPDGFSTWPTELKNVFFASAAANYRAKADSETAAVGTVAKPKKDAAFRVTKTGVEKRVERIDKETGASAIEWKWFCSILEIEATTRNSEGEDWGRLLRVVDLDAKSKTWAMPMSLLAGDGSGYRERLLSLGLTIAPGKFARDALHEYISTQTPRERVRCVGRIGWHGRSFVLPDQTLEDSADE